MEVALPKHVVLALATAVLVGCSTLPDEFHCTTDAQCAGAGPNAACALPIGYCVYDDASCAPYPRYHSSAGAYAGICLNQTPPDMSVVPDMAVTDDDMAHTPADLAGADLATPVITGSNVAIIAGTIGGSGEHDDIGDLARLNSPVGAISDGAGGLYIADTRNFIIRKLDVGTKHLTYYAGSKFGPGGSDGARQGASFFNPSHMVKVGVNVYFPDALSHTIRVIDTSAAVNAPAVSTFAGAFGQSGSTDNVSGGSARFNMPFGIASDGTSLYVSEQGSHTIRKIDIASRLVTRIAGVVGQAGLSDGALGTGKLNVPAGMALAGTTLYIAERGNNQIRKLDLTTNTLAYVAGHTDGTTGSETAAFNTPSGCVLDGSGNLLVADVYNHRIRSIAVGTGVVSEYAGTGASGSSDGSFAGATFRTPTNIVQVTATTYAVVDESAGQIRLLDASASTTSTLAGRSAHSGLVDGPAGTALFNGAGAVAVAPTGEIYVADRYNQAIRMITGGTVSDVMVTTPLGFSHTPGNSDGSIATAGINQPTGLVWGNGKLFIADSANCMIRTWDIQSGMVGTLVGGSGRDCGTTKKLKGPQCLSYDATNDIVYFTDPHSVYQVTGAGVLTLIAGQPTLGGGEIDGPGLTMARFDTPTGIALAGTTLYVADTVGRTIRAIDLSTASHPVTTVWGSAYQVGSTEGVGAAALFVAPRDLLLDGTGSMYLADLGAGVLRKIDLSSKSVSTFVGTAGDSVVRVTSPSLLNAPSGLALHPSFGLVTTSTNENVIMSIL